MTHLKSYSKFIKLGWLVIFLGTGLIISWASLAKLESAAIAYGVVEPLHGIYRIQHLEGGLIESIHIHDGSAVKKGQLLFKLDKTSSKATYERIRNRLMAVKIIHYRLGLELKNKPWILQAPFDEEQYNELVSNQKQLFQARYDSHEVNINIIEKKINALKNEKLGLKEELYSAQKRVNIYKEQLDDLKSLIMKKMVTKTERLKLETGLVEYRGKVGRLKAHIARVDQKIGETQLNAIKIENKRSEDISKKFNENQEALNDLSERLNVANDVLKRKEIVSMVDGVVTNLAFKNIGEVIGEGETLMHIVPSNQSMIIRAKIHPDDIDVVKPGLSVDIRLTAYSSRRTHSLEGHVISVSPNRQENKKGQYFFEAVVQFADITKLRNLGQKLYPGMTAQVVIINGEKTVWQYLVSPVIESLELSLREQ